VLFWLCTDQIASARVTHRGIRLRGMRVEGELNLADAKLTFPFVAESCAFMDNIILTDARLRTVAFGCCFLRGLDASRAHIEGEMILQDGCQAEGPVLFYDTIIDGGLNCEGAQLRRGLGAARAKIGSTVYFRNGFRSEGEVQFGGATIGGDFDCQNSWFINPGGALLAGNIKVTREVVLREIIAEGPVSFAGADIGTNFNCSGSVFNNPGERALDLDGGKVGGQTFWRDGFVAFGEASVIGAKINGNLECDGAQIYNPGKVALLADRVTVGGNVFLRPNADGYPFTANGEVGFLGATIAGNLECDSARLTNPDQKASALTAETAKIGGNVFLRRNFKAEGVINFIGAEIARSLIWVDVELTPSTIVYLRSARIASLWTDATICPEAGKLHIDGLVYDRIFDDPEAPKLDPIKWLRVQSAGQFRPQPYEQLASVLRAMGREREAKDILVAKNSRQSDFTKPFSWPGLWYNVVGPLIGYGYRPGYAFGWSVLLIVVGAGLFWLGYDAHVIEPTKPGAYATYGGTPDPAGSARERFSLDYPKFNAFVFSLESFTPLLRLDQSSNWAPNAKRGKLGRFLRIYLWCHVIAGWILTSLWVGSITGLVKT
jgi:hypothetical protein